MPVSMYPGLRLTPEQQAQLDRMRGQTIVPSRTSLTAPMYTQADWDRNIADTAAQFDKINRSRASQDRLVRIGQVASAIPLAVAAAPALGIGAGGAAAGGSASPAFGVGAANTGIWSGLGASGAATSAAGTVGATAANAGRLATVGKMFNSPGMNLGVNAALSYAGMRSGQKAADQARSDQLAANAEAIKLQREQMENEARNANLDREDARALNDAINKLKERELAATEEQRAFDRNLVEQRETRLTPYRKTSEQAMARLASMWGLS